VMIMLDEFNRLGKMPIVVESIETLRTYRGHLAVVTQTIPALDEIYGENTRRALQGNAGVKLYLTPSDEKTVEELSKAVGKTTKTVITRSQSIGKNPFEGRSQSTRTEESSLLPEDEARRLPLDEIVMVIDAQMPVRAKRIQYFDDRLFKAIHAAQTGELPFPEPGGGGSQGTLPLSVRAMPMTPPSMGGGQNETAVLGSEQARAKAEQPLARTDGTPKKSAVVVQAVVVEAQRQMEMDFVGEVAALGSVEDAGDEQVQTAVNDLGDLEKALKQGF
ncbi:type IV secretory system conjugative DNA transfer family protein, partial [Sulfitobacter sp. HI0040]